MQAIYWDSKLSIDNIKFEKSCNIENVQLILEQDQVNHVVVYSKFSSLAQRLFQCSAKHDSSESENLTCSCRPLVVFLVNNQSEDLHQVLQYLNSQFAHSPACCAVLSQDRADFSCNIRYGAVEVCEKVMKAEDVSRILLKADKLSALLKTRSNELRAVLGMTNHEEDYGFNSMTRFIFLNDDFSCSTKLKFGDYCIDDLFTKQQQARISAKILDWNFYAHEFDYDELVLAAVLMLQHALMIPSLKYYALSESDLITFVLVVREAYHSNNPYHNFRHAIDVLQATFYFLKSMGALDCNNYSTNDSNTTNKQKINGTTTLQSKLTALETLTTLVVAMGHDVGHPGVTNAFLVSCNAPIAKVYNDRSVLESFHSVAFLQMLRSYWPQMCETKQNSNLIIDSVLATDMAMHFEYMKKITSLQSIEQDRNLVCCILIKCADISNVARNLDISTKWGKVLSKEFAQVANLEVEFGLKKKSPVVNCSSSSGSSSAHKIELETLAKGQLFFIETYAGPLFSQVKRIIPQLEFATDMINSNANSWKNVLK